MFVKFLLAFGAAVVLRAQPDEGFLGRWALTTPDGRAGWLEIVREDGWFDGALLWEVASVVPLGQVVIEGDVLTVTRVREVKRMAGSDPVERTRWSTEVITATRRGDELKLTRTVPRPDSLGFDRRAFTGRRIPPLPPPPDRKGVRFGDPVVLFDGRSLEGWRLSEPDRANGWSVENGTLVNRPPARGEGGPRTRAGNLRTLAEFEDFNLTLEVNLQLDGGAVSGRNSGVFLRGIYEVQIFDSHGKRRDSHHMGAIYSRITPAVSAEKPLGEWQSLDITLWKRHVTVVLNGVTIIDNQPLVGITGAALWSDQFRPGPIILQGDHGPVAFRHVVLRPILDESASSLPSGAPPAKVSNTPFRRYKQIIHEGGIATPLLCYWPAGIARPGRLERQPGHVIDLMPTLLEVAGAAYPDSYDGHPIAPSAGLSFGPVFRGERRPEHPYLFWEHTGNRGVRAGDWKLVSSRGGAWELYDIKSDRTEKNNVAGQRAEMVRELAARYEAWAAASGVVASDEIERRRGRRK